MISTSRRVALFALVVLMATAASSAELIVNGEFEAGNTGFSTDYVYHEPPPQNTLNGQYWVGNDPSSWHGLADSYGDHTSGNGLMMIVNAYESDPGNEVWGQTVSVAPNTDYELSMWVSSWSIIGTDTIPLAHLTVYVNSWQVDYFAAPDETGVWEQHSWVWNSGANSQALISIVADTGDGGDFALDDISLVPEPTAILLFGCGAVGLLKRRRTSLARG